MFESRPACTLYLMIAYMQVPSNPITSAATSTGVFLGNAAYPNFTSTPSPAPQMYPQQFQGEQPFSAPLSQHICIPDSHLYRS